jgi:hypothetical protein
MDSPHVAPRAPRRTTCSTAADAGAAFPAKTGFEVEWNSFPGALLGYLAHGPGDAAPNQVRGVRM